MFKLLSFVSAKHCFTKLVHVLEAIWVAVRGEEKGWEERLDTEIIKKNVYSKFQKWKPKSNKLIVFLM